MNRIQTALLAAFEATIVVAAGVGAALVPLTILWAVHFELALDWVVFWRAAADVWLLGHGVDLTVTLDAATAAALALPGSELPFTLSLAPLGFALLTLLLGVRTGRRAAEARYGAVGLAAALAMFLGLSILITLSAAHPAAQPAVAQGILLPPMVYALGCLVGVGSAGARAAGFLLDRVPARARTLLVRIPSPVSAGLLVGIRLGAAAVTALLGVAALLVTVLLVVGYATLIGLYEIVQAGVVGGFALTLAQLALLPDLVVWAASWLVGPGFAVGTGTNVSPVGTIVGPLPGLPVLGALPTATLPYGFLGILVPVLAAATAGVLLRRPLERRAERAGWGVLAICAGSAGITGGVLAGLLAWWASGSAGPGRLADVGPSPWLVGLLAAAEIAVGALLGLLLTRRRAREDEGGIEPGDRERGLAVNG